jgi:hypothetical protein
MPPPKKQKPDPKEQKERVTEAKARAIEAPQHFVDYLDACVQSSVDSMRDVRLMQEECWRVFCEDEPYNYSWKEDWQARVIYPKPFKLVQGGAAIIRKIFEMDFLSVEKKGDQEGAMFWRELLLALMGQNYAKFPTKFSDSTAMALAIGQSMEMIPYWLPKRGLRYSLIEPFKIHRDQDAISRESQSGEFWVHQEYMGLHRLLRLQEMGKYKNIDRVRPEVFTKTISPESTLEEIARRKFMVYQKHRYIKACMVFEFWGTVVGPHGELLLDDAHYTVAGNQLIEDPAPSPYPTLRWPGTGYSALPHILRFDGRGLIQGIKSLWYLMCNLMSLHSDHLNWAVNPPLEIDIHSLIDEDNTDIYPGKVYHTHSTVQGQQAVRAVRFATEVGDLMAILNFFDQRHQDGGLMDYHVMGLPGYRHEVTKGEAAQNLDQSMVLVSQMGKNVEEGALDAIRAAAETIQINMTYEELVAIMGEEVAKKYRVAVSEEYPTGLRLPELTTGTMHVSGISGVMKDQEILKGLLQMMELFDKPVFQPFFQEYNYLKAIERRLYLQDEGILVSEEAAKAIMQRQQEAQEDAIVQAKRKAAGEAEVPESQAEKHRALAEKARGEATANVEQAGLFKAQAEQTASGGEAEQMQ